MKAVRFHGINDMRFEEIPDLRPGPGEVVLKVLACAVCGTDRRILANGHKTVKPPAVIGHEIAGRVHALGAGAAEAGRVKEGDHVVVVTPVGCGACRFCREGYQNMCHLVAKETHSIGYYCDGGFSEYMVVPAEAVANGNLIPYTPPPGISHAEISLTEPLSCCINGQSFMNIRPGDSVAIYGAGAIGCMHAVLARHAGASSILLLDVSQPRLDLVRPLGLADELIHGSGEAVVDRIMTLTGGKGVDHAICACSSAAVQQQAFQITGIRGRISLFAGVPPAQRQVLIDTNDIHYQEKSVFGAFASAHHQYREALELIVSGKVSMKKLVSLTVPLEGFHDGVAGVESGALIKVVVTPHQEEQA